MDNQEHIDEFSQMLDHLVSGRGLSGQGNLDPKMVDIASTLATTDLSGLSREREALRRRLGQRRTVRNEGGSGHKVSLLASFSMGFATILVLAALGLLVVLPLVRHSTDGPSVAGMSTPSALATAQATLTGFPAIEEQPTEAPAVASPQQPATPVPSPMSQPQPTVAPPPTAEPTATEPQAVIVMPENCPYIWFTAAAPAGSCPSAQGTTSKAAYQLFEHGAMIWREGSGYIVLPFDPSTGQQRGIVTFVLDPITPYRDTSAKYTPPSGLYAPVSGFGILWRGDYLEQEGSSLLDVLGWALATETGYTVTEQTGTLTTKTGEMTQVVLYTYLTLPDGSVLELSRLADPSQPTSMRLLPGS